MKTHTSKQKIWLRTLLLLPLVTLTLYGFSETKEVIKEKIATQVQDMTPILMIQQNPLSLKLNGKITSLNDLNSEFIKATNGKVSDLNIESNETVRMSLIDSISNLLNPNLSTIFIKSDFGITDNRMVEASKKPAGNEKNAALLKLSNLVNAVCHNCSIDKNLLKNAAIITAHNEEVKSFKVKFPSNPTLNIEGNKFNTEVLKLIESSGSNESFLIFDIKTKNELIDGSMTVNIKTKEETLRENSDEKVKVIKNGDWNEVKSYLKKETQQKAALEEIKEYNKLAKYYNSMPIEKTVIKLKDAERMKFLYNKMEKEQKSKAEPFPNMVPTPPSPPLNAKDYKTGFLEVDGSTIFYTNIDGETTYYNRYGYIVDKNGNTLNGSQQVNAYDVIPGQHISKVYKDGKVVAEFKVDKNRTDNLETPVSPPPPKSTL